MPNDLRYPERIQWVYQNVASSAWQFGGISIVILAASGNFETELWKKMDH